MKICGHSVTVEQFEYALRHSMHVNVLPGVTFSRPPKKTTKTAGLGASA
jgi:hypothetical protein